MSDARQEVRRIEEALLAVAAALSAADLDRLLECEAGLALAVSGLRTAPPADAAERLQLRVAIASARRALQRCRRLGAALRDMTAIADDLTGAGHYTRPGAAPPPVRVTTLESRG